jgi:ferredoxin
VTAASFRVHVDPAKCQGHNRCYSLAPELFQLDDLGQSSEHGDGAVPPERLDQARRAVANCPEYAISLEEVTG